MGKIYTKQGDKGQTSLLGGSPVSKAHPQLEAYGSLDELNAILGTVRAHLKGHMKNRVSIDPLGLEALEALDQDFFRIQNYLFDIGSHLAVGDEKMRVHLPSLGSQQTLLLEQRIDEMEKRLPPLKNFILPGGLLAAAQLHVARTVARRCERLAVVLETPVKSEILVFLNRLSDFLFVAARFINFIFHEEDILWQKNSL